MNNTTLKKYYLFQAGGNAMVYTGMPDKPGFLIPYKALCCDESFESIEKYFNAVLSSWKNGMDINVLSKYTDFKMESDSLDEIIEHAVLNAL